MNHGRPTRCTVTRASNATQPINPRHRSQVGRDGQIVRLTTLQPTGASDAKRARVDGVAEGGQQEQEEEAPKEELSLAAQAEKAVAELGAAAGWDEEIRARCVLDGFVVLICCGFRTCHIYEDSSRKQP